MKLKLTVGIALLLLIAGAHRSEAAGQDIKDESGNMFMEETTPAPRAAPKQEGRIGIDLSNVGVPIDPHGHIVPLIDKNAPNGIRRNFSNLEVYSEPAWNFLPAPVYNGYGQPYNFAPNLPIGMPYGMPYRTPYGMPYGMGYRQPYQSYGNNIGFNLGRNLRVNLGTPGGYAFGNPYGYPYGMGSPFGFGGVGGVNLNPITNPLPIGANFGAPYMGSPYTGSQFGGSPFIGSPLAGSPFGYPATPYGYSSTGGLFGPSPFPIYNSPLLGSSLFSGQSSGLGLNLFVPPTVEWQSKTTYTPLTPNLDGPP